MTTGATSPDDFDNVPTSTGRRLLRRGGHASPRILAGESTAAPGRAARGRLRVHHRHLLPSRWGQGPLGEHGFSTAELLGNAALGIAALIAIWVVLEALGVRVVEWIGSQIGVG